jgi:hypothetical protein
MRQAVDEPLRRIGEILALSLQVLQPECTLVAVVVEYPAEESKRDGVHLGLHDHAALDVLSRTLAVGGVADGGWICQAQRRAAA